MGRYDTKMPETEAEAIADEYYPRGCVCGGGDCNWCIIYYDLLMNYSTRAEWEKATGMEEPE